MTVLRTGSNQKYAENWENIFGGKKKAAKGKSATTKAKKKVAKKSAKKSTSRKAK